MSRTNPFAQAEHLLPAGFLLLRKLVGPSHRRRRGLERDQNDDLPPLPPPWEDERWFRGGFPPRRHNRLHPLLHGFEYFEDLYNALLGARERVTICGWCLTPLMPLLRDERERASILADLLREVSSRADVYVLLWSGAPALFEPTTRSVEEVRRTLLEMAPRVHCELDRRAHFSHDHHQKGITVDGRVAYVGGIDLSTFQGDRWDTHEHRLRFGPNWHDVQLRLEGEVVRDVEENFCRRWQAVTGEDLTPLPPDVPEGANTPAQIVRTVPAGFYPFAPHGEFGIHHALISAINKAERYIYLENQYIWAPEVVDALEEAIRRKRSEPFRVVLVLPAKAYSGKYDNDEHVRRLSKADGDRGVFHPYSLYSGGPAIGTTGYHYLPIYVHAKVSVVDDEWVSVGSANLNRRGLVTDTEMNVQTIDPALARSLRVRLWAEHLGISTEEVAAEDPITLIDDHLRQATGKMETAIRTAAVPPASKLLAYVPGHNPGSRLLDILQDISLER